MAGQVNLGSLLSPGGEPAEAKPTYFTVTPAAIRVGYGSEIFQLRNITRIGKYKVKSNKFGALLGTILVGGPGLLWFGSALVSHAGGGSALGGLVLLGIGGIFLWNFLKPGLFAFGFECNSGASRYFYTTDETFIDKIVQTVSEYMESKQKAGKIINIEQHTIENCIISDSKINQGNDSVVK